MALAACLFMTFAGQAATIRYVKLNGTGDGSSWANAAGNIQTVVNASVSGDQVWIASGTYPLTATLTMKEGVNVYGGFLGNETDINNRHKSDLNNNGIIEPWEFTNATILDGQNARRVLYQADAFDMGTTWDGITITRGSCPYGAGAYIRANGKLNNCIIQDNKYVILTVYSNTVIYGGGIYNDGGTVNNCTIHGNNIRSEHNYPGRIAQSYSHNVRGAGIYNNGTVSNCVICNNYCGCYTNGNGTIFSYGGGIYNAGIVSSSCIYNNETSVYSYYEYGGGAICNQGYVYCSTILNNMDNGKIVNIDPYIVSYVDRFYKCITENSNLTQNFIRPTSFAGVASNDAQRAELLRADWRLKQGSQYIETGSLANLPDWVINGTDLAGNPRVSNGKISMGAYEFDPKANNAIKSTHFDNDIKIYPNPVSDSFIVDYESFIQVKIYDMLGKEIVSQDTNGKTEINVNHLSKGIYNVRIVSEGRIIGNSKIVKK